MNDLHKLAQELRQPAWVADHLHAWLSGASGGWELIRDRGLWSGATALEKFVDRGGPPSDPDGEPYMLSLLLVPRAPTFALEPDLEQRLRRIGEEGRNDIHLWMGFTKAWVAAARDNERAHYFSVGPTVVDPEALNEFLVLGLAHVIRSEPPDLNPEELELVAIIEPILRRRDES